MKFNKPPFSDSVVNIATPPNMGQSPALLTDDVGETESPMAHAWASYNALLNDQLSANLSDNGYIFPSGSTTTITKNLNQFGQSIVYNQSLNRMELNNGNRQNPQNRAPTSEPIQTYGALSTGEIATEAVKPGNLGKIYVNSDTNELQFSTNGTTIRTIVST